MEEPAAGKDAAAGVKEAKGKAKEKLGWATGDRQFEAEGVVDQQEAAADAPGDERGPQDVEPVDQAEQEVRQSYDELK